MKKNYLSPEAELIVLTSAERITDDTFVGSDSNTHEDVPDDF